MVASATSFGRSGLHDWLVQRVTAVVLAVYVIYLASFTNWFRYTKALLEYLNHPHLWKNIKLLG